MKECAYFKAAILTCWRESTGVADNINDINTISFTCVCQVKRSLAVKAYCFVLD